MWLARRNNPGPVLAPVLAAASSSAVILVRLPDGLSAEEYACSETPQSIACLKAVLQRQYLSGAAPLPVPDNGVRLFLFQGDKELGDDAVLTAPAECCLIIAYCEPDKGGRGEDVVVRLPADGAELVYNVSVCCGPREWSLWPAVGGLGIDCAEVQPKLPMPRVWGMTFGGKFIRRGAGARGELRLLQVPREMTQVCCWARICNAAGTDTTDAAPPRKYHLPIGSALREVVVASPTPAPTLASTSAPFACPAPAPPLHATTVASPITDMAGGGKVAPLRPAAVDEAANQKAMSTRIESDCIAEKTNAAKNALAAEKAAAKKARILVRLPDGLSAEEYACSETQSIACLKAMLQRQYLSGAAPLPVPDNGVRLFLFQGDKELGDDVVLTAPAECCLIIAYCEPDKGGRGEDVVVRLPADGAELVYNVSVCCGPREWSLWPAVGGLGIDCAEVQPKLPMPRVWGMTFGGKFIRRGAGARGELRLLQVPREMTQVCCWARICNAAGTDTTDAAPPRKYHLPIGSALKEVVVVHLPELLGANGNKLAANQGNTVCDIKMLLFNMLPFEIAQDISIFDLHLYRADQLAAELTDDRSTLASVSGGRELHLVVAFCKVDKLQTPEEPYWNLARVSVAGAAAFMAILAAWEVYNDFWSIRTKVATSLFFTMLCAFLTLTRKKEPSAPQKENEREDVMVYLPADPAEKDPSKPNFIVYSVKVGCPGALFGTDFTRWVVTPSDQERLRRLAPPISGEKSKFIAKASRGALLVDRVPSNMREVWIRQRTITGHETTEDSAARVIEYKIVKTSSITRVAPGGPPSILPTAPGAKLTASQLVDRIVDEYVAPRLPIPYGMIRDKVLSELREKLKVAIANRRNIPNLKVVIGGILLTAVPPPFELVVPLITPILAERVESLLKQIDDHIADDDAVAPSTPGPWVFEMLIRPIISPRLDLDWSRGMVYSISLGFFGLVLSTSTFSLLVAIATRLLSPTHSTSGARSFDVEPQENVITGAYSVLPIATPFAAVIGLASLASLSIYHCLYVLLDYVKDISTKSPITPLVLVLGPLAGATLGLALGAIAEHGSPLAELAATMFVVLVGLAFVFNAYKVVLAATVGAGPPTPVAVAVAGGGAWDTRMR